jgi:hypothetical protein
VSNGDFRHRFGQRDTFGLHAHNVRQFDILDGNDINSRPQLQKRVGSAVQRIVQFLNPVTAAGDENRLVQDSRPVCRSTPFSSKNIWERSVK